MGSGELTNTPQPEGVTVITSASVKRFQLNAASDEPGPGVISQSGLMLSASPVHCFRTFGSASNRIRGNNLAQRLTARMNPSSPCSESDEASRVTLLLARND